MPPSERGRTIAILAGGRSAERDVSLTSGAGIHRACVSLGLHPILIDPAEDDLTGQLARAAPHCVFNALHGPYGEDGRMQGFLETLNLAYTHSGVMASAVAMDKGRARHLFAAAGLDIAKGTTAPRAQAARAHILPPPYVVKPIAQGSSFGVIIVEKGASAPPQSLTDADWPHGDEVLIEEFIPGHELTVAVMDERPLAVTEIVFLRNYYDYSAKYDEKGSRHVLPADLPGQIYAKALEMAQCAHRALGCRGVTRSDLRYDPASDRLVILETNTQPGMTPVSLVPEQAAHLGVSFEELVEWIVNDASCLR